MHYSLCVGGVVWGDTSVHVVCCTEQGDWHHCSSSLPHSGPTSPHQSKSKKNNILYNIILVTILLLSSQIDPVLVIHQLKKGFVPDWVKGFVVRSLILALFSVSFLLVRMKLNQTPPRFHV